MRFADRVSRAPQQVLRYAYGGQPLWSASDPPKVDVRPCACGEYEVCFCSHVRELFWFSGVCVMCFLV